VPSVLPRQAALIPLPPTILLSHYHYLLSPSRIPPLTTTATEAPISSAAAVRCVCNYVILETLNLDDVIFFVE
jgi:hypothetical protein